MRQQAQELDDADISRIASSGIERLTNIIDESKTILTMASLLPTFSGKDTPDCHRILTPIVAETAWINSFSAISADGRIICSSSSTAEGLEIGDRPYLRDALAQHRFQLSGLVRSRRTGAPALLAAVPVSQAGSKTAALVMAINASWFTDVALELARAVPGSVAMIVDAEGNVIEQSRAKEATTWTPEALLHSVAGLSRDNAHVVSAADGQQFVLAARDLPHSRSLLLIAAPRGESIKKASTLERSLLQDLFVFVGVIVLVFWLGHESFVKPITSLAAAARRLGRGKFDVSVDSHRWASEFQTLASAIASAGEQLADRARADAELKANLRAQSLEDPLTRLSNRRGLDQYVELEWRICVRNGLSFAAIAFDIDFFKPFNDCYGHDAGDQALRAVGNIMRDQAAQAGGLAARTGGEEFTIVIPGQAQDAAKAIADAVSLRVTALRMPHLGSPLGVLTISAGIAVVQATREHAPSDVFRAADTALYGAKEAGRNTITVAALSRSPPSRRAVDSGAKRAVSPPNTGSSTPQAFPLAKSR